MSTNTVVLTRRGREILVNRLGANAGTFAEPKYLAWGGAGNSLTGGPFVAANTDVAMMQEWSEARTTGTSSLVTTNTTNDTYQVVGGVMTASTNEVVAEIGQFCAATKTVGIDTVQTSSGVIGSSSGTTVIVATGANFSANQYIQIRTEVMKITSISTNTLTVTRAQDGSTAISTIAVGDPVQSGNAPGSTAVTNGDLFVHATWTPGFSLNTGDSLTTTTQISFS